MSIEGRIPRIKAAIAAEDWDMVKALCVGYEEHWFVKVIKFQQSLRAEPFNPERFFDGKEGDIGMVVQTTMKEFDSRFKRNASGLEELYPVLKSLEPDTGREMMLMLMEVLAGRASEIQKRNKEMFQRYSQFGLFRSEAKWAYCALSAQTKALLDLAAPWVQHSETGRKRFYPTALDMLGEFLNDIHAWGDIPICLTLYVSARETFDMYSKVWREIEPAARIPAVSEIVRQTTKTN